MRLHPLHQICVKNNTHELVNDIKCIVENRLLKTLKEKTLCEIILEYVIQEVTIFDSPLFTNCIDVKLEKDGKLVFLKEEHMVDENDEESLEFFLLELFNNQLSMKKTKKYDRHKLLTSRLDLSSNEDLVVEEEDCDILFYDDTIGKKKLITKVQNFQKILNVDKLTSLLELSKDKFIIMNDDKLFLLNEDKLTQLHQFESSVNGSFDRLASYENSFMMLSEHQKIVILGNVDEEKYEVHDLKNLYKIPKKYDLYVMEEACHKTSNPRFVTFECQIYKDEKVLTRFICHIDIQEKKIKTKVVQQIDCLWTVGSNSVLTIDNNGKIVQHFI